MQFVRRKFTEWGWPLTKENIDKRLLRHGDITTKICPNPWIKSIGYKTNWTWEQFKEAVRTGVCPNATSDEDTIKELQARFIAVGFGMGCKKGKPDGDWGKTSKSDCKKFCKLYALNEVEYPDDAVLKKLEEVEKVNNPLVFDWEYYLKKNKDLKEADITEQADALAHFVMNGIKEGNRPSSPTFSLPYYTKKYKDLASLDNLEKVYHFMSNGIYEGRRASSEFNLYKYYGNYEDLREAFGLLYTDGEIDAKLVRKNGPKYYDHFVTYGYKEGRTANKKI